MAEAITVARKPKQGNLVRNEGIAIYCMTADPWYRVRKYMRLLPPWSRLRKGYAWIKANRPAMFSATEAFAAIASKTAGVERWQRRGIIAKVLAGKSYPEKVSVPRKPGKRLTPAEVAVLVKGA